jgi:DNA-binding NtrC family response regulator
MPSAPRVLVVDASAPRAVARQQLLGAAGYETTHVRDIADAVSTLARGAVDVVIATVRAATDIAPLLGSVDDASLIAQIDDSVGGSVHALGDGPHAVIAVEAPADAFLAAVERAMRDTFVRRELALLRARASEEVAQALIGRSSAVTQLRELIGRAAASQRTVLVTGEAGSGKDVVARLVHDLSERATRPFVRLRCSGVDAAALERELFGVAPSAKQAVQKGLLESARGGTVVLDECTALPYPLRARVAQAIVDRAAPRVGDGAPVALDVRILLTTREPLGNGARYGMGDVLFDGMSVLPICIPPLRERRSDIPLLVQHFRARLVRDQGLTPRALPADAMMSLLAQEWTGNVRELEHWVEQDAFKSGTARHVIGAQAEATGTLVIPADASWTLDQLERRYILHVLEQEEGNQSRAAERLGIDRRTLYRKLKDYRELQRVS